MLLLDANISIYAEGREHFYRGPCRAIMNRVKTSPEEYAIDAEALQEIMHVYSNRGETARGINEVEALLNLRTVIIPITVAEIWAATRLLRETPGLSSRDAVHAAVVLVHRLEGIISTDRGFDRIPGVRRYDPAELAAGPGTGG